MSSSHTLISIEDVGCPLAVVSRSGELVDASCSAMLLLKRCRIDTTSDVLPEGLWQALNHAPLGVSIEWRPPLSAEIALGASRYRLGAVQFVVLMREITGTTEELARRLQQQRLEAIGRLVAGVAHDLRAPLASIVFSAGVLARRCEELTIEEIRTKLGQITQAAERQRATIAGILDFARLGPPVEVHFSLNETLSRVSALLRPKLREGGHQIAIDVGDGADMAHGNPLVVEQILVNLVLNAAEAERGRHIRLRSSRAEGHGQLVEVHVIDDGPGIPEHLRGHVFEPFFTTKKSGTGLGLTMARDAAIGMGGDLLLIPATLGTHFLLTVPGAASTGGAP